MASRSRSITQGHLVNRHAGPVRARDDSVLVRDWQVAQAASDRPVKITLPGPLTIMDTVVDDHYGDRRKLARDLAAKVYRAVAVVYKATDTFWENYAPDLYAYGMPAKKDFCGWTALVGVVLCC